MRCCGLFLLCFILCSCGGHSATNDAVESTTNSVVALEKSLPKECATESINAQITAIKTQINTIGSVCEMEKAEIRKEKVKWQTAFWGLLVVIAAYIIKKVLK